MFTQRGISSLELLLSLTIASSVSAFTLTMSEEVEDASVKYQKTIDIKALKQQIQTAYPDPNKPL